MRMTKRRFMLRYWVSSYKNTRLDILSVYPLLIRLLRVKSMSRGFVVKARDLRIYLGINDHYTITIMGRLLSLLDELGYARKLNNSRPIHYALDPRVFGKLLEKCKIDSLGEQYCIETRCSLMGICPYWIIKSMGGVRSE